MTKFQALRCLFGFHDYKIPHKEYSHILLCKHCKRFGCLTTQSGHVGLYTYDNKGREIHYKANNGYEVWQEWDKKGNIVHRKHSTGFKEWFKYNEKGGIMFYKDSNNERWCIGQGTLIKTEAGGIM